MNERIKLLAEQATETVKCGLNGTSTAESFNRKKFAELILKECLSYMNDADGDIDYVKFLISRNFGVEE